MKLELVLKNLFIGLPLMSVGFTSCSSEAKRPNIIFLLTDDQRFDALGCAGNPYIKTPHIDQLAEQGVYFPNAYVTTSISCASRASIFTGQYASCNGIHEFNTPFSDEQLEQIYPTLLQKSGYYTGFIGKYGVGNKQDPPIERFDFWRSFYRQGWYYESAKPQKGQKKLPPIDYTEEHLTSKQGKQIIEFLNTRDKQKPFCLSVSFKAPHCQDEMRRPGGEEFPIDMRDSALYDGVVFPRSLISDDKYYEALSDDFRTSVTGVENEARRRWQWRFSSDSLYQASVRKYYSLISGIDREVGNLVAELERQGIADNTIIVLMGDNGYYLGEHGLAGKWFHHEPSMRVPFLVYDPQLPKKQRGKQVKDFVLNIDVAPTLLSYAGVEIPASMQGESVQSLLYGDNEGWRDCFYFEYTFNPGSVHLPEMEGIVKGDYKLVRYYPDNKEWFELYCLKSDPNETTNLYGCEKVKEIQIELLSMLKQKAAEVK